MKIGILSLLLVVLSCKNVPHKETEHVQVLVDSARLKIKTTEKQKKLSISSGLWISTIDSLSTVKIKDYKWTFKYKNEKMVPVDSYNYLITKSVFDKDNSIIGGDLILYNTTDTLKYSIDYISDKKMNLIYFPRGNFHHYVKKE